MRLFHVSEDKTIKTFNPRKPSRKDLIETPPLVWAITEKCLPNFTTPRDCPRVTFHVSETTTQADRTQFFASHTQEHCVAIEAKWYHKMRNTKLYVYEFETKDFYRQDEIAGYYVSELSQKPIAVTAFDDLFGSLMKRNVEIRILDNLLDLRDAVMKSSLNWSMCRMGNAEERK